MSPWMPAAPSNLLGRDALRPGDVLLSATGDWPCRLIRWLDGGDFSDAGLYDGDQVVTVTARGLERRPLYRCDVFRFHDGTRSLGPGGLPADALLEQATRYLEQANRYACTPLYQAGLLMIMRRLAHPAWRRVIVERCGAVLVSCIRDGIERLPSGITAMTPVELVVRIYADAARVSGRPYDILLDSERRRALGAWRPTSGRFEHLMQETEDVLARVNPDLPIAVSGARTALPADEGVIAGGPLAPACFVSPADLQHSRSLVHIGRIGAPSGSRRFRARWSTGLPT